MKRYYRIDHEGTPRHVVEESGAWRLVDGRHLRPPQSGRFADAAYRRPPAAGDAVEDRGRRPQLPRPRRGAEQAASGRAAHLHQAVDGGDRVGRLHRPAGGNRTCRSRSRGRGRDRRTRPTRARGGRSSLRVRHHLRQRRLGARSPEERRAVHSRQGVRHVRARRTVHHDRSRLPRAVDRGMGQRRAAPGIVDRTARSFRSTDSSPSSHR